MFFKTKDTRILLFLVKYNMKQILLYIIYYQTLQYSNTTLIKNMIA